MKKYSVRLGKNLQIEEKETPDEARTETLSASLVTQGENKFYTLTMPIRVLAECATVEMRAKNPLTGFQRNLDEKRATEIARYVDAGNSIPTSIVLSAQPDANLKYTRQNRSITFNVTPRSFYILDGQHRVYGFAKAKTQTLRVPVVVFSGLSLAQECKLFIDINTTQRPVPNALLLDIKKLANEESDDESLFREVFDRFADDTASPLLGLMSPSGSKKGAINRVTFNGAMRAIVGVFDDRDVDAIYEPVSAYLAAWKEILRGAQAVDLLVNATVFKAILTLFIDVAQRVDSRGDDYSVGNFEVAMADLQPPAVLRLVNRHSGKSRELYEGLRDSLSKGFKVRSK